jgi:2'-5' RNA ligase
MRCFVAIELADEIKKELLALQGRNAALDRAVRWVSPEQMHLTLKFLGEVPDANLPAVCEAMASVASKYSPITFAVRGVGCFPPGGAVRIFWVGVEEPTGTLGRLRNACEDAFASLGFAPERRSYTPHLTLGRVKDPESSLQIREAARREGGFDAGRQRAEQIMLFQSILSPQGSTYVPLARAQLGPRP